MPRSLSGVPCMSNRKKVQWCVFQAFKAEWENPDKYLIATNRGITAFLKILRSILKSEEQELTKPIADKYIRALRKHWKGGWETANLKHSYVGNQRWRQFHDDMAAAIRKELPDFTA